MRKHSPIVLALAGLLALLELAAAAPEPDTSAADMQTLRDARLATDAGALLEFFRQRTLSDANHDKVLALIRKLGDDSFTVREQATADLLALKHLAIAPLRRAVAENEDIEIVRRAEKCLATLDRVPSAGLAGAAARLLARQKPAGAATVLLAYLPFADDDTVVDEVRTALLAVAMLGGHADKSFFPALQHGLPVVRGTAAEVLIRAGGDSDRQAARKLLRDRDPRVRLQVARALVETRDKEGVPVLIALLAELPQQLGWQAEELLYRLAGEKAPSVALGTDTASRQKCSEAWGVWWRDHGASVDLAKLELAERLLGYTLVVQIDNIRMGRVFELGLDGKPRWQIENLLYPVDAQVLPGNRVLIAEYRNSQVSERDFNGTIHWQRQVPSPIGCQRLRNGNTFIAARNQLLEVDRAGKLLLNYPRNNYDIMSARKFPDGAIAFITNTRVLVRLDPTGTKELKSFPVGSVQMYSGFDVLPRHGVLVPELTTNRVVEYDADGKAGWSAPAPLPTSAMRLPNGNTLIATQNGQRIIEVNREGREVWSHKVDGRPWRAAALTVSAACS